MEALARKRNGPICFHDEAVGETRKMYRVHTSLSGSIDVHILRKVRLYSPPYHTYLGTYLHVGTLSDPSSSFLFLYLILYHSPLSLSLTFLVFYGDCPIDAFIMLLHRTRAYPYTRPTAPRGWSVGLPLQQAPLSSPALPSFFSDPSRRQAARGTRGSCRGLDFPPRPHYR
ncbi:hypothetical protein LZ30DRAFT_143474 [Colletotrichum cereale]|nr:hypothetical protein LZ30DRAFT_143474 [Colletotrichum cereale]